MLYVKVYVNKKSWDENITNISKVNIYKYNAKHNLVIYINYLEEFVPYKWPNDYLFPINGQMIICSL